MGEAWPGHGNIARKQDHALPVFAKLLSKDRFFADSLSTLPTQQQETPAHKGARFSATWPLAQNSIL